MALKPSQTHHVSSSFKTSLSSSLSSSSCSTSSLLKLKTLLQTFIFSHICRFFHELSKRSSFLIRALKEKLYSLSILYPKKQKKKIIFGSFRLHYNWCSSHVLPVSIPVRMRSPDELCGGGGGGAHLYYDSTWNSTFSTNPWDKEAHDNNNDDDDDDDGVLFNGDFNQSQLSGYLQWLEDKVEDKKFVDKEDKEIHEIDKLADMFIASCHEKFRLEKVESYRRFQEMLARSL